MIKTKEKWKQIPSYEKEYYASNLGRIKSIKRKKTILHMGVYKTRYYGGKTLKLTNNIQGYCQVQLSKNGVGKLFLVHRLVGLTFIKNVNNKPCINHLNGMKKDNRLENLNWCTYAENEQHSYKVLGKKPNMKNLRCLGRGIKSPYCKPVVQYDLLKNIIGVYGSASEAGKKTKISQGEISSCCRGERNVIYKSFWEYINKNKYYKLKKQIVKRQDNSYILKSEFAKKIGRSENYVNYNIQRGKIKKYIKTNTRVFIDQSTIIT